MTVKISSMTATFNDVANTYIAIGMDVTDTASAANSALIDLKVGGTSKFAANKNGSVYTNTVACNTANVVYVNSTTVNVVTLNATTVNAVTIKGGLNIPAYGVATAEPGQLAYDSSFLYVCVAGNTWKKVALAALV